MLREWLTRLRNIVRPDRTDTDLKRELQFHLDMETEAGLRHGLGAAEAARQARISAGSVTLALEELRDQRTLGWLEGSLAELRQSAVTLRRHPGFTIIAIAALAFAVAMNTLIFTLFDGVLLKPLPYPAPQRLVRLFESTTRNPKFPVSLNNFQELRRNSRTLANLALYTGSDLQLTHGERPERVTAVRITPGFLPTLGISPLYGRNFTDADTRGTQRVVILSNRLWRLSFDADKDIVGKSIRLQRESWTVVGVLPPGVQHIGGAYRSPGQGDTVGLWWPLRLDLPPGQQRNWHFTNAIARLRAGVSVEQAREELTRLSADLQARFPDNNTGMEIRLTPLSAEVVGQSRGTVWLLAAAGALVLLIACANVAGLCLARSMARRKELAVRAALGAGTWRVVRVLLCENLLLGVVGGIAGLALAGALSPAWRAMLPTDFPRVHEVHLTYVAALFALASAVATSLAAGIAPALRQRRVNPADHLNDESRGASSSREARRFRTVLVAGEVAFAALLCAAAVLLLHSSLRLGERDHGFQAGGVLSFTLALPGTAYAEDARIVGFYGDLLGRLRALPGVRAAGLGGDIPWTGYDENSGFDIPGRPADAARGPQARFHFASTGYFEALRIPLRAGHYFEPGDDSGALVVIINESLARRYLAGENPIGRVLDIWDAKRRVVGVVADVYDRPADLDAEPAFWFPLTQMPSSAVVVTIRTAADPLGVLGSATDAVHAIDRELPVADAKTMSDVASMALGERNLANWLFQAFAGLALVLAIVGIYGLLSYVVQQRHKEFGIRMALGASRADIVWLVLKDGALQAGAGGLVGIALAPLAARSLSSLLYGVTPVDPVPLLVVPLVILAAAILASLIPAALAARTAPATTLRADG